MQNKYKFTYPFAAVQGQEKLKKALILNIINPNIGGLLISGQKGTAKSTLVRALPQITENYSVIDLPLNISVDRLVGSINIEDVLKKGHKKIEYGILHKANGNILYIDEVNLLSNHITSCLLEVATTKINNVQREAISYQHEANFLLIATMNPEEGTLRPQLVDRFGLYVESAGCKDLKVRKNIMKCRLAYEANAADFIKKWQTKNNEIKQHIKESQSIINKVCISDECYDLALKIVIEAKCQGHRADLTMIQTAKAIAAYDKRLRVGEADIIEAAEYVIKHRKRELQDNQNKNNNTESKSGSDNNTENKTGNQKLTKDSQSLPDNCLSKKKSTKNEEDKQTTENIGDLLLNFKLPSISSKNNNNFGTGKRNKVVSNNTKGRYVKYKLPLGKVKDLAFLPTLKAALPFQQHRLSDNLAVVIKKKDYREKVREKRIGSNIVFVVDASGSMGANKRMRAVKGAIFSLLNEAYQKRDKIGLIVFKQNKAEVILNITRSVDLAQKELKLLPTGGKTPLAEGLKKALSVIKAEKIKDKEILPLIVLVSDGKANYSVNGNDPVVESLQIAQKINSEKIPSVVIDTENGFIKLGLAKKIAEKMNSDYFCLENASAKSIENILTISRK